MIDYRVMSCYVTSVFASCVQKPFDANPNYTFIRPRRHKVQISAHFLLQSISCCATFTVCQSVKNVRNENFIWEILPRLLYMQSWRSSQTFLNSNTHRQWWTMEANSSTSGESASQPNAERNPPRNERVSASHGPINWTVRIVHVEKLIVRNLPAEEPRLPAEGCGHFVQEIFTELRSWAQRERETQALSPIVSWSQKAVIRRERYLHTDSGRPLRLFELRLLWMSLSMSQVLLPKVWPWMQVISNFLRIFMSNERLTCVHSVLLYCLSWTVVIKRVITLPGTIASGPMIASTVKALIL